MNEDEDEEEEMTCCMFERFSKFNVLPSEPVDAYAEI